MRILPGIAQTYSKSPDRYGLPNDVYATSAKGSFVTLSTGEKLVDLTSGMGAVILGHRDPYVDDAIRTELSKGMAMPLPGHLDHIVAERLLDILTWERAQCVRFGKNGADVTGAAVKLSRAFTGRREVAYVDYHGHHPWSMIEPPMNGGVWEPHSTRIPHHEVIERVRTGDFACIVLEACPSNMPGFQYPVGFWKELRKACDAKGTVLVLDEMVTGFRMATGGAAEALGIEPDLACYGKAMANGMPLSAIVGPWDIMQRFEKDVFFSTTHGGETLSLAAANATMETLVERNVCSKVADLGIDIISHCIRHQIPVRFSYPQRLVFDLSNDQKAAMREKGVLCAGYANLTLSHWSGGAARRKIFAALWAM